MARLHSSPRFVEGEAFRGAAIDLGGSSGRVVTGVVEGGRISIDGLRRFTNHTFASEQGLRWDVQRLFRDAAHNLIAARARGPIASVGVDAWAGDYALLSTSMGPGSGLIDAPFHQRDRRTAAVIEPAHQVMSARELFGQAGVNEFPSLTLFQLLADRDSGRLSGARRMLLIPDLFTHWLGGAECSEATSVSTTGLALQNARAWDTERLRRFGLPEDVFAEIVTPGTITGEVRAIAGFGGSALAGERTVVTAVASHDTASAVAAVPAIDENFAYISCGTWALVGVETDIPVISEAAREAGFTNELGVDDTVRFLHISPGMWIINECLREWGMFGRQREIGLQQLLAAAAGEPAPRHLLDIDASEFLSPGNMCARIGEQLQRAGAKVPDSRAGTIRLIVESLAESFARRVAQAAQLSGVHVATIYIVGGGSQAQLLCQRVADRSGLPVVAGPTEATAIGNLLVQARTMGAVRGALPALRKIVRASFPLERYAPSR